MHNRELSRKTQEQIKLAVIEGLITSVCVSAFSMTAVLVSQSIISPIQVVTHFPILIVPIVFNTILFGFLGGLTGLLVGLFGKSLISTILAIIVTISFALVVDLALGKSNRPPDLKYTLYVLCGTILISSYIASCYTVDGSAKKIKKRYIIAFVLANVCVLFFINTYRESVKSNIYKAGGSIKWSVLKDDLGRWIVEFNDSHLNDADLHELLPSLHSFSRLELDLSNTNITDAGVSELVALQNIVELRLDHTSVSEYRIELLRDQMSGAIIIEK